MKENEWIATWSAKHKCPFEFINDAKWKSLNITKLNADNTFFTFCNNARLVNNNLIWIISLHLPAPSPIKLHCCDSSTLRSIDTTMVLCWKTFEIVAFVIEQGRVRERERESKKFQMKFQFLNSTLSKGI